MTVIAGAAALLLALGLLLLLVGRRLRRSPSLGGGTTLSLDDRTFHSRRHGLLGRPDRIVRGGGAIIPEEWKSASQLRPWHRAQMGVYFLVIEEELGVRPPYGIVVCGGERHRIENDAALRAWVIDLAGRIRAARRQVATPILVHPMPGQCRPCGLRIHCRQARL